MIIQQLYRYIFSGKELTDEERRDAKSVFRDFIHSTVFCYALKELQADRLCILLYGRIPAPSGKYYFHRPTDESLTASFSEYNKKYGYFNDNDLTLFFALSRVFTLFRAIVKDSNSRRSINVEEFCYKLMVCFGDKDIETTLANFEAHCQANQCTIGLNLFDTLLPVVEDNKTANLAAWRALFLTHGLNKTAGLFAISGEIESVLGCLPNTLEQAVAAAKSRRFKREAQCPEYARFCVEHQIPERLFNLSIDEDSLRYLTAISHIAFQLSDEELHVFIKTLPMRHFSRNQMCSLLERIPSSHHLAVVERFGVVFNNIIADSDSFWTILRAVQGKAAQSALLECMGTEWLQYFIKDDIWAEIKRHQNAIEPSYYGEFIQLIIKTIGKENLPGRLTSFVSLKWFMSVALPEQNHVTFMKDNVGLDTVRRISNTSGKIVDQLWLVVKNERLNYLVDIIGKETLIDALGGSWNSLLSIITTLPKKQRAELMFNIIGLDVIREIIPVYGNLSARLAIEGELPDNERATFLDRLLTDEDKIARGRLQKTKQTITERTFNLGIGSWVGLGGGEEITLDDESKKTVPHTVKLQWEWITRANRREISYSEAWSNVHTLAQNLPVTWGSFFRSDDTTRYYESVSNASTSASPP